jgi:transcriptional regulator with XRE-family HTH domain
MENQIPTALLRMAREKSGSRQADVAAKLEVSATVLSRLESSDTTDTKMAKRYLEILDTELGRAIIEFFGRDWRHLNRPEFQHPERETIWAAEQAMQTLETFERNTAEFDPILQNPLNNLRKRIEAEVDFISRTEHSIALLVKLGLARRLLCLL